MIARHWPLLSLVAAYWLTVAVLLVLSAGMNQGHLVYALDDAYIHMSMAKNLVAHHVWGVTRYHFASSTSSPLWTALLALTYRVFGVNDLSPLVLNLFSGALAIAVGYLFLRTYAASSVMILAILLVAVFTTPLPALTLTGMEHVLHAALSLAFVYLSVLALSQDKNARRTRHARYAVLLAPLITATRYEGVFLVLVVGILLLLQRRALHAAALWLAASLPPLAYGLWSMAQGWYFLPNSVLLKARLQTWSPRGLVRLLEFGGLRPTQTRVPLLLFAIASLALLLLHYLGRRRLRDHARYSILILAGCMLLHVLFASTGWFYRYEAYLVFVGIVVFGVAATDLVPEQWQRRLTKSAWPRYTVVALLGLGALYPFGDRAVDSLSDAAQATNNIYEQQYQMGTFLGRFYQGESVALNDIGATTYLADIRLFDTMGLATLESARARLNGRYADKDIYELTRADNVAIALVYNSWIAVPAEWECIGNWVISDNVVAGSDTVSLYAVDPSARDRLLRNLRCFAADLPADVTQRGQYTSP